MSRYDTPPWGAATGSNPNTSYDPILDREERIQNAGRITVCIVCGDEDVAGISIKDTAIDICGGCIDEMWRKKR